MTPTLLIFVTIKRYTRLESQSEYNILAVVMASMTERENLLMYDANLVYSYLSSQQLEVLLEDFQIAFFRNVRYDTVPSSLPFQVTG